MAIKTRPMPRLYCSYFAKNPEVDIDRGNINDWKYYKRGNFYELNYIDASITKVYVPKMNGYSALYNSECFKERKDLTFVDFQYVPTSGNSLYMYFWACYAVGTVKNINENVTNMSRCFEWTRSNVNVKIPQNVTNLCQLFTNNYMFNRSINIPNKVINMHAAFNGCLNLNQSYNIPNSVVDLRYTFMNCANLNSPIVIGKGVTCMDGTFRNCNNFASTVTIYSTELDKWTSAFYDTPTSKKKTVRIYYNYKNGVATKSYDSLVANSKYKWHGYNGVTVVNMGKAPW